MNAARVNAEDYTQFLIGSPVVVTGVEAARVQPHGPTGPHHDAYTRLLHRLEPDPVTLWSEVAPLVRPSDGVLVLDDTTLDKPRAQHMDMVGYHWSGNHRAVVKGINLITLLWSDGDQFYPLDYRVYHKSHDGLTKNDHFGAMLQTAHERGFKPRLVLFDSWYASVDNLKTVRDYGWRFLTRLKSNRKVRRNRGVATAIADLPIAAAGTEVWLPELGLVKVFRIVAPNGDTTHWMTNHLTMSPEERLEGAELAWAVEEYHRGIKQFTGVARCQVRSARGQRNHILCALRAFVRLEYHRFSTGISWFDAKLSIIREAVRGYLAQPRLILPSVATA